MERLLEICAADRNFCWRHRFTSIDLTDRRSSERANAWWEDMTGSGGEGMVVKPLEFVSEGTKGIGAASGESSRARVSANYLWTRIYAARQFAALEESRVGCEAFARSCESLLWAWRRWNGLCIKEPLRRVHECVFGVLALESEPVDPRL